jgi:hypothetical protein
MALLVLGPLLRYVGDTEASVWVETDDACEVDVLGHTARTFEVRGHHYAMVGVTGLEPGTVTEYTVKLDGAQVWPPTDEPRPRPAMHTRKGERQARLVFGSCRVGAPEREPYTRPPGEEHGFGIDALWAYSRRLQEGYEEWPDALLLIGDQVYADEVSPATLDFIRARRDTTQPPGEEIADFEEYTQLYRESWSEPDIRWLLATVPSVMIFDDHDVIDDWNISWEWLRDARSCSWWDARITGAFMSYWLYQHIGNLTPQELAEEPMYRTAVEKDGDVGPELETFARRADHESAASRWASLRDFGSSRVLVVDSRAARVLDDHNRELVDDREWDWIVEQSRKELDHLLIVSTLPVFLSPGVHHLESWNEAVCNGVWGRPAAALGERLRRALDLEHWPAFHRSFVRMVDLLRDVATDGDGHRNPPASVSVIGGDIHNAYVAEVSLGRRNATHSRVHQIVCSPFRNPLAPTQRRMIKLTGTRAAGAVMGGLAALAGVRMPAVRWRFCTGPTFDNSVGIVELDGRRAEVTIYRAEPGDVADALQPLHSHLLSDGPRAG